MSTEMYEGMTKAQLMPLLVSELNQLDKLEEAKDKVAGEWKDKIKEQELHVKAIRAAIAAEDSPQLRMFGGQQETEGGQ